MTEITYLRNELIFGRPSEYLSDCGTGLRLDFHVPGTFVGHSPSHMLCPRQMR